MKILFVTEDHSIHNYGITTVVSQLADELAAYHDVELSIFSPGMEAVPQDPLVNVILGKRKPTIGFWGWNKQLQKSIDTIIQEKQIELVHIHGIWMASQWAALKAARKFNIPCVVSAHGMLEPWLWNKQGQLQKIKKTLYFNLVFKPALTSKVVLHAITPFEQQHFNEQLPGFTSVVIPNAILVSSGEQKPNSDPSRSIIFLGRIHPKKGVELLIEAFAKAKLPSDWNLYIIGPDSVPAYTQQLKQQTEDLGLQNQVMFTGPLFKEDKEEKIHNAWILVTPSYSEVMGMVNLEAAIQNVPSITTFETGMWDWEEGGGLLVHPEVEELSNALQKAAEWTLQERLNRGQHSIELVKQKYSWQAVIPKWVDFYSSVIHACNSANSKDGEDHGSE